MMKPNTFTNPIKILRARNGFGIIEVMVAAGLLLIISVGMTALLSNMQKEQRRQTLLQVLVSQKNRFENAINNASSWANTLNAEASMACLRTQTACSITAWTGSYSTGYQSFALKDGTASGGSNFYTFAGADGSIQGFTESGTSCNTFTTAAAGNDACPIGYRLSWAPQNTADVNPKITVYAKMIFNPSDSNPFKTFLNASASITTLNTKYDVAIDRTGTTTAKVFTVSFQKTLSLSGTSNCTGGGFGTCSVGSFANYPGTRVIFDPHGLIDTAASTATNIVIKQTGKYKCNAKSYAFGTNGAQMRISRLSPAFNFDSNTFASQANYGYSTIIMDTVVEMTVANTAITFQQKCDVLPTSHPAYEGSPGSCSLGFSGNSYTGTADLATLNCILVD